LIQDIFVKWLLYDNNCPNNGIKQNMCDTHTLQVSWKKTGPRLWP